MTDYYTQFSYGVKVSDDEAKWADTYLRRLDALGDWDENVKGIALTPSEQKDPCAKAVHADGVQFEWKIEREGADEFDTLWVMAQDHGSSDHAALFLQQFLKKWHPTGFILLGWAATCSKMEPGAFGGGAIAITATALRFSSSFDWCDKERKKLGRNLSEVG